MSDPFNCPKCGAHDYGLYQPGLGGDCPHCLRATVNALHAERAESRRWATLMERDALRARVAELEKDAARWKLLTRIAGLGFDDAPLWKAVIRLPVFDNGDQTITALVDRIAIAERAADKGA